MVHNTAAGCDFIANGLHEINLPSRCSEIVQDMPIVLQVIEVSIVTTLRFETQ